MTAEYLIKGIIIGFSIAAPVGPIGILTLNTSIQHGSRAGFAAGLGAATADAVYGLAAGLGLGTAGLFLQGAHTWIQLVGGIFLCGLGLAALFKPETSGSSKEIPTGANAPAPFSSCTTAYATTFALTLANPMTILAFAGVFSGLGLGAAASGFHEAGLLVTGVFTGSSAWWLILATGTGCMGKGLTRQNQVVISRISGILLLGMGVWALLF